MNDADELLVAEGPVLLALDDHGVARIRLNRPQASNGLDVELLKALHGIVMTCHGDPRVRAVLLTGEGKNFCAGGDVHVFASKGAELPHYLRMATSYLQIAASALMRLNAPVVAAVQGFAAGGGGLGLVCSSDLVVAGESAKFLAGATRVGMAPDAGVSVTLTRLVGLRKAMEIVLTNPIITAAQALEIGLINRVVPDDRLVDEALSLARQLAAGAPQALAAAKRLVWNGLGLGVDACMPEESRAVAELSGTADAREGLAAVIERRPARFTGG
ncbi:MAG: enoyl-CoA hydratase/isomerase family protein [Burkholderiaceae bacterium]|nr:enoyl-CoA hydratase/isomerase family protein [Burkholderiaceae bacterium]